MPITEEQRQQRRNFVGSSDVSALLGVDPFKSPLDIYRSKTEDEEEKTSDVKRIGNFLEAGLVDYVVARLRGEARKDVPFIHPNGILAANCDAIIDRHYFRKEIDTPTVLEIKTSGFNGTPPEYQQWGKGGTEEIPPRVYFQVQQQLACTQLDLAIVAMLSGCDGKGCRLYRIKRNPKAIKAIELVSEAFWNNHVKPLNPPDQDARRIHTGPLQVRHTPAQGHPEDGLPGGNA